jgi:hypothetical protein
MKRNFIISYILGVGGIFALSWVYEFLKEGTFGFPVETTAEQWEYVFTVTAFSMVALIPSITLAYKFCTKLHSAEKEKLRLQQQLDGIITKLLGGFVGICCVCKKIRVEDKSKKRNTWESVERYISKRTDLKFSHCYCPDCFSQTQQSCQNTDLEN